MEAAYHGGERQPLWHPTGCSHLTSAGESVHAPVCAGMEAAGAGAEPWQSDRELYRRPGDLVQTRQGRGGPAENARDHGQVEAHGQQKTRVCKVPEETFDFPGFAFGRMYSMHTGQARPGYRPSKRSIQHMVRKIHALTAEARVWQGTAALVGQLNRMLRGWASYFQVGSVSRAYRALDSHTMMRLRRWLRNAPQI